jgi:hypothetical protein
MGRHQSQRACDADCIVCWSYLVSLPIRRCTSGLFVLVFYRFKTSGVVVQKQNASALVTSTASSVAQIQTALNSILAERQRLLDPLRQIDSQYRALPEKFDAAINEARRVFDNAVTRVEEHRARLSSDEAVQFRNIEDALKSEYEQLAHKEHLLKREERVMFERLQEDVQHGYVQERLKRARIDSVLLVGIGDGIKSRLKAHGIFCAADVDFRIYSVPGIGPQRARTLEYWRAMVEAEAKSTAPAPSPAAQAALRSRLESMWQDQVADRSSVEARIGFERDATRNHFAAERAELDERVVAARMDYEKTKKSIQERYDSIRRELKEKFKPLKTKSDAERPKLESTARELQESLFRRQVDLCAAQRELDRYRSLAFLSYLRRILGLRRK